MKGQVECGIIRRPAVEREPAPQTSGPQVGQWYWLRIDDDYYRKMHGDRYLACVTHLGSNYAQLNGVVGLSQRVHLDRFSEECEYEPDAERIMRDRAEAHEAQARRLMHQVRELTESLGLAPRALAASSEAEALVRSTGTGAATEYGQALECAGRATLPELFKKIREEHEQAARWMKAPLIPLEAQSEALRPLQDAIKQRIFNVELYAGLVEQVVQVSGGAPAGMDQPVALFQRRHYMDEECLARYETGGMEFADLPAFDAWMARPENRDRLLPLPRCVVSFKVRRRGKDRESRAQNLAEFISLKLSDVAEDDKKTFLYLRNGDQVWRLSTGVEFGERLFPDQGEGDLSGRLYALTDRHDLARGNSILDERGWAALLADEAAERAEYEAELAAEKRKPKKSRGHVFGPSKRSDRYVEWTPETVYYDDIAAAVNLSIAAHNRLVMVLQGLFDRSPVFHPHAPVRLWTADGFQAAVRLVYDDSRTLAPGAAPDFAAYRARLNASLRAGSVTVGQEEVWLRREAAAENLRRRNDWRIKHDYDLTFYQPDGDPGPGVLAAVVRVVGGKCTFRWQREKRTTRKVWVENPKRPGWGHFDRVHDRTTERLVAPVAALLNASAYTPGDFRQFFADPRTRADYLQWAPLLLAAEEWRAGNRTVGMPGRD